MGAAKRLMKFGIGGLLGAGVGAAIGILFAPQSGDELKEQMADRLREAQVAGAEAKAAKEEELIHKYRAEVGDPDALQHVETQARLQRSEAVAAIGLGLNAPGALAAQELAQRAAVPPSSPSAGTAKLGVPASSSGAPGDDNPTG